MPYHWRADYDTAVLYMRHFFGETKSLNRGRLVSESLGEPAYESQVYQQGLLFFFPSSSLFPAL